MAVAIVAAPGTPTRLDADCPECGWADLWQVAIHSLTPNGVGTLGLVVRCMRCARRTTEKRRRTKEDER